MFGWGCLVMLLSAGFFMVGATEPPREWGDTSRAVLLYGVSGIGLVIGVLGLLLFRRGTQRGEAVRKADPYTVFSCVLCGYRWSLRPGESQPAPRSDANPELARLGAQRLAEEERKRQEAAQAAWFLEQQRRRK